MLLSVLPLPAQSPAQIRERVQHVLQQQHYQTTLPGELEGKGRRGRPDYAEPKRGAPTREYGRPLGTPTPAPSCSGLGSSGLATALLYALGAAVVAVALFVVVRSWLERRRPPAKAAAAAARRPPSPSAPELLDFEALARAGRLAEAVHAMLLHAFVLLADRRGQPWPQADTGREILAAVGGFGAADEALRSLFRTAEGSRFGGRPVSVADYETCRSRFSDWRSAWQPPKA